MLGKAVSHPRLWKYYLALFPSQYTQLQIKTGHKQIFVISLKILRGVSRKTLGLSLESELRKHDCGRAAFSVNRWDSDGDRPSLGYHYV